MQLDRHCGSAGRSQQLRSERCDKSKHNDINHKFRSYLFTLHVHIIWDKAHFTIGWQHLTDVIKDLWGKCATEHPFSPFDVRKTVLFPCPQTCKMQRKHVLISASPFHEYISSASIELSHMHAHRRACTSRLRRLKEIKAVFR